MQKTFDLFDQVTEEMKLRYINVIQKTYNLAGRAFSWNDKDDERELPTRYLLKAEELYNMITESSGLTGCKLPRTSFNNNYQNHLLNAIVEEKGQKAKKQNDTPTVTKAFAFFINGGLDKDLLEQTYIETL